MVNYLKHEGICFTVSKLELLKHVWGAISSTIYTSTFGSKGRAPIVHIQTTNQRCTCKYWMDMAPQTCWHICSTHFYELVFTLELNSSMYYCTWGKCSKKQMHQGVQYNRCNRVSNINFCRIKCLYLLNVKHF